MNNVRFKYYLDEGLDVPAPIFGMMINTGMTDASGETVLAAGKPLPLFPDYKTWRREVLAKRRCGRCWATTRGLDDLVRHVENRHPRAPIHMPIKEQ